MNFVRYSCAQLERFCRDAFQRFGFTEEQAAVITDVLLLADLYDIRSHGTQRLVRYHKAIENETIIIDAKPEIVFETPVSAVVDGHAGMGQLIGHFATKLAIQKAKKSGMAFVTVRNSNHYGIAGYYTKMMCDEGLFGISTTNTESIMVHTNARQPMLGSNPIAFAMPAEPYPFWFDAATTVVPRGKLEVYHKEDKPLGDGWAIGREGKVSTDAEEVLDCINSKCGVGGILPVGGASEESGSHKGYGYSMICELLSAITSGGDTSNHHIRQKGKGAGTCHSFIAFDPKIFGDPEGMKERLSVFLQELRDANRADENIPIYTHGEKEIKKAEQIRREGVDVNISTVGEMKELCDYLGMDSAEYLGEVDLSHAKKSVYGNVYNK